MSKIFVVGNVLKDVYLKLDERQNNFERDEKNIAWLDLAFNGEPHRYFHRQETLGGAAVSLSICHNLGLSVGISNFETAIHNNEISWNSDPADYRYIFTVGNHPVYFIPSARATTLWQAPEAQPAWILVDRSTTMSEKLADAIVKYLQKNPNVKLAVHIAKDTAPAFNKLIPLAKLIFVEANPVRDKEELSALYQRLQPSTKTNICYLDQNRIIMNDAEESWSLERTDLVTHLTIYSTIAATILSVIALGGNHAEALLWAKINTEFSTINKTSSYAQIEKIAKKIIQRRAEVTQIAKTYLLSIPQNLRFSADESSFSFTNRNAALNLNNSATNNLIVDVKDSSTCLYPYYDDHFRLARYQILLNCDPNKLDMQDLMLQISDAIDFIKNTHRAGLAPIISISRDQKSKYTIVDATRSYSQFLSIFIQHIKQNKIKFSNLILESDVVAPSDFLVSPATTSQDQDIDSDFTINSSTTSNLSLASKGSINPEIIEYATNSVFTAIIPPKLNCVFRLPISEKNSLKSPKSV